MFIVSLPPFQDLIDAHWRDVARLSYALAGPTDAEDVAQQAWTQALAAYPTLRSTTNLRGWLLTITRNCAMDAERQRTAIALRYIVDLDHADLARALGTTPGATRRLVSDGLARLRTTTEAVDRPEESR